MKQSLLFKYITSIALGLLFCVQSANAQLEVLSSYPNVRLNNLTELLANENVTVADLVHDSDATGIDLTNASLTTITQAVNDLDAAWGYKVFDLGLYQSARSYQDSGAAIIQEVYDALDTNHDKFILNVFFLKNTGGTVEYISKIKFDTLGSVENSMTLEKKESIIADCAKAANDYQVSYPLATEVFNASAKAVEQLLFSLNRAAYTIRLFDSNYEEGDTAFIPLIQNDILIPTLIDNIAGTTLSNATFTFGGSNITDIPVNNYSINGTQILLTATSGDISINVQVEFVQPEFFTIDETLTYASKPSDETNAKIVSSICDYKFYTHSRTVIQLTGDNRDEFTPSLDLEAKRVNYFYHFPNGNTVRYKATVQVKKTSTPGVFKKIPTPDFINWDKVRSDASNGTFPNFRLNPDINASAQNDTFFYRIPKSYKIPTTYITVPCEEDGEVYGGPACYNLEIEDCERYFYDFSSEAISLSESTLDLLSGNSSVVDSDAGLRRDTRSFLFLTDQTTTVVQTNFIIDKIDDGKPVIWLKYENGNGWTYNGNSINVYQGAIDLFVLKDHNNNEPYSKAALLDSLMVGFSPAAGAIDFLAGQMYEFLDFVSKGIDSNLVIPAYIYDTADPKYDGKYLNGYKFITKPIQAHTAFVLRTLEDLLISNPLDSLEWITFENNLQEAQFGAICGIWNGGMEIIKGVPEILKLFAALLNANKRLEYRKLYNQIDTTKIYHTIDTTINQIDTSIQVLKCEGFLCVFSDVLSKEFGSQASIGKKAHNYTTMIVGVAIGVVTVNPAATAGATLKTLSFFIKTLKKLDDFAGALVIGPFKYLGKSSWNLVSNTSNRVAASIKKGIFSADVIPPNSAGGGGTLTRVSRPVDEVNISNSNCFTGCEVTLRNANDPDPTTNSLGRISDIIASLANKYGVDPSLFLALAQKGINLTELEKLLDILGSTDDVVKMLNGLNTAQLWNDNLDNFVNDLFNTQNFRDDFVVLVNNAPLEIAGRASAWKVLNEIANNIGVIWKTDIPTLNKLSSDISLNPNLEGWLKNNPGYFDIWNNVKHVPPASRADIGFLQALRNITDANLIRHVKGEYKVTPKTAVNWKIRVKGYHKDIDIIDLPTPLHGTANVPDPTLPSGQRMVTIGTPAYPAEKGKVRISQIMNDLDIENLPYTAKIDAEIPPGSGNFFPKTGVDGINPGSGRSSMFPTSWNEAKILEETAFARKNMTPSDVVPNADGTPSNLYKSLNSEGTFEMQMYINGPLNDMSTPIGSTFPKVN